MRAIEPADERVHPVDPAVRSWSESWFFSWIDLDGGASGFFRVGVLPNQQRAMLWSFVHDGTRWLGREESTLPFEHVDLTDGLAYDAFGLRFGWRPDPPLEGGRFTFDGTLLERTGAVSGAHVPVAIELDCAATGPPHPTGVGHDEGISAYEAMRFEQPLRATGTVRVGDREHTVRAGAHRDKSWGPREWRVAFTLGDLQAGDRQLWFVARSLPGPGGGFLRTADGMQRVMVLEESTADHDDEGHTISGGTLCLRGADGDRFDVTLRPISPSVTFDMAHTCEEPEHWLYWRTLVEAEVPAWGVTCRGWFESSRYGTADPSA